jgi:MFS family permease
MTEKSDKLLFWGCYVALITTSYAFISRVILCGGQFKTDFGLDAIRTGELIGAGIWPFGISIILFSFIIDRVGYKLAMLFSFACYVIYAAMAFMAHGAVHGVTGDACQRRRNAVIRCSTGGASSSASATAPSKRTSIRSSPRSSRPRRPSGSTSCTQVGQPGSWPAAS